MDRDEQAAVPWNQLPVRPDPQPIWTPTLFQVCAVCHMALGGFFTLAIAHWGLSYFAGLAVMAFFVPKELLWDVWLEYAHGVKYTMSPFWSEMIDVGFYAVGCGLGTLVYLVGG